MSSTTHDACAARLRDTGWTQQGDYWTKPGHAREVAHGYSVNRYFSLVGAIQSQIQEEELREIGWYLRDGVWVCRDYPAGIHAIELAAQCQYAMTRAREIA